MLHVKIPGRYLCHIKTPKRAVSDGHACNYDTYFLSPLKRFFNWSRSSLKILSQYFSKFYLFIQKNLLSDILNTAIRQSTEYWANKIQNNGNSENKHFNNLAFD